MIEKSFVDTNILVYSVDKGAGEKLGVARDFLNQLRANGRVCISSQVVCEFVNVLLVKLQVSHGGISHLLRSFDSDTLITISTDLISDAVTLSAIAKINFWDALIVESAASAGCSTLYTEDLNHGQVIRGVKVVNPFLIQS